MPIHLFNHDRKKVWFLLAHIHFNDNTQQPRKDDPDMYDKLYKVRPLLTHLNKKFQEAFIPSEHQAIDEAMIKFKGRSSLKQYMPAKPIKRGYKVWVRADACGYICEFEIYTGKVESVELALGARVVKQLSEKLAGKGYKVFF